MSIDFTFFYDIAVYGNEHWKGSFTPKEIAINAHNYYQDYQYCIEHKQENHTMQTLLQNLKEDIDNDTTNSEAKYFYDKLKPEVTFQNILDTPYGKAGIIPADCHDCNSCYNEICTRYDFIIKDSTDICDRIHGENIFQLEYTENDDTIIFSNTPLVIFDTTLQQLNDNPSTIQTIIPLLNCDAFEEIQNFFKTYYDKHQTNPNPFGFSFEKLNS